MRDDNNVTEPNLYYTAMKEKEKLCLNFIQFILLNDYFPLIKGFYSRRIQSLYTLYPFITINFIAINQ